MKTSPAAIPHLPQQNTPDQGHSPTAPASRHDLEQDARIDNNGQQKSLLNERKLTIAEAARTLSIGAASLRRIIANGGIPVVRMTKKTLILESDLETFLAASREQLVVAQPVGRCLPQLPPEVAKSKHLN